MSDANATSYAARIIVQELCAAGVGHAVLCPGMRNAPLLFALAEQLGERAISHIDERSGAFIALGIAKRSKKTCVICVTSGSALANVLPALCEAYAAHIPLIILSADRPPELHHSGAPQCMQQFHIFDHCVASSVQLPSSKPDTDSIYLCSLHIREAMQQCLGQISLPIHINVPLCEPLAPIHDDNWQQLADPILSEEFTQIIERTDTLNEPVRRMLSKATRPLVIVGPDCPLDIQDIIQCTEIAGIPLIADACSGLRASTSKHIIRGGDLMASNNTMPDGCDLLIRIGAAPLTRAVYEYCSDLSKNHNCPVLRLDALPIHKDFLHKKFTCIVRPTQTYFTEMTQLLQDSCDNSWLQHWQQADQHIAQHLQQWTEKSTWGEVSAAAEICANSPFDILQCSSSMSVRHANTFASHRNIIAHRGVNGIDGSIGSFIGTCIANPTTSAALLCGDLAFLHDLSALSSAHNIQQNACIFIMNNHGGRIFDLLPISQAANYEKIISTEQHYHIANIAQAFNLDYAQVTNKKELQQATDNASQSSGCSIIEIQVSADSLKEQWAELKISVGDIQHYLK